jgi:histidine ammonia-lyase
MRSVTLGTGEVGVAEIVALASGRARTALDPTVMLRLDEARQTLDHAAATGTRIYGLNTGLGAKVGIDLGDHPTMLDPAAFQNMLVRGRAVGVGDPVPNETVRAVMAARCAMLAQGGSGLSPHVFQALCALLDAGVHPRVPRWGSLGESDLGLLAHVALVLIGEGLAEHDGVVLPGAEALRRAGLAPVTLAPKDGLSLVNASAFAVGAGALTVHAAAHLRTWQDQAAALSFAAASANPRIFEPALQVARPAPGQPEAAYRMQRLLEGSAYPAAALQDPLSFRCLAPIMGALADSVERAGQQVRTELNGAGDNPLVLVEVAQVLSTGNFAMPAFALAFENLGLAVAQAAQASAGRFLHLTNGRRPGLPRGLSPVGGMAAGFVPLQKTVMALMAEIRRHAAPAMLDFWPVSEGVEDHATQAPLVVAKTDAMLDAWRQLIAIELLATAQAVDLQADLVLGPPLAMLHRELRHRVAELRDDRPLGADAQILQDWIALSTRPS